MLRELRILVPPHSIPAKVSGPTYTDVIDFHRLVAVLDPDVVLRVDAGAKLPGGPRELRGAEQVAHAALTFSRLGVLRLPALVNGTPGLVCTLDGKPFSVMAFTIRGGKIAEIYILHDPDRLSQLDLRAVDG